MSFILKFESYALFGLYISLVGKESSAFFPVSAEVNSR